MADLRKLGRYELRRVLGKGAMGVVYEGFDPTLGRPIAVKTILKSVVTDAETAAAYSARFVREAKAAARLSHANIVQVYDFGEENEIAYLVMEFIQGRELRGCFEARERFEAAEAVRIMDELLGALEFAHEAGVIHRDVKPANVMLDGRRHVKLADFGVARLQEGGDLSKAGTMVGTPAFMAPEQISGGRVDRRTDIFSAGIVLYQLLTGEQPFEGEGAWTVAKQIMQNEPPRPSTIATNISPAFDQIVNRALAKKPDQRFGSAREFATALQGALAGDAVVALHGRRGSDIELEFWRSIQGSGDPAEFRVYLTEFPNGVYAELARIKLAKLRSARPAEPEADESEAKLAEEKVRLEAALAAREAEFRRQDEENEARRDAEARAWAEAEARREIETRNQAAVEEEARLEAIEKAKKEVAAELAKKEAEYAKREAEAEARRIAAEKARAEADAKREADARARREAEAKAKQEAEALAAKARAEAEEEAKKQAEEFARSKAETEARAKKDAEERAKHDADAAKREAELKKKLAAARRAKVPVAPVVAVIVAVVFAAGAWYWWGSRYEERVASLTAELEGSAKATQDLNLARRRQEELLRRLDVARQAEDDARARGDLTRLKELETQTRKAEAETQKQAELIKLREADAKKAEDAAKLVDAKKQGEAAKVAEKAAQEKAILEKMTQEKAAKEKAEADRLAAEKTAADKLAVEKAAADKVDAEKAAAAKAAAAKAAAAAKPGWPSVGDRWVYEVLEVDGLRRKYAAAVSVQAVGAAQILDVFRSEEGGTVETAHQGAPALSAAAPGVASFLPYLRAFKEVHAGERWSDLDTSKLWQCGIAFSCAASARVVGMEKVVVRAGSFDAWKIVIDFRIRTLRGGGEFTLWYAESVKRIVKYQSRVQSPALVMGTWMQPNVDMELVSYTPAK